MTRSGHWRRERRCGGSKLKAYELQDPGGVDAMMLVEKPVPAPGPGQVLVKLKAVTINYRDLLTVKGGYGSRQKFPLVPLSDGAGVVESVGVGVTSFKAGDRVTGSFFEGWLGGEPSEEKMRSNLGGALDGVLCEYRVWPAAALVRTPDHLSDAEAASLPCAGLTAWSAVIKLGNIRSGQTVLTQGTGGVSIFALQFAKMSGARVIATSSSEAKIEKLKQLGADVTINYKTTPEWGKLARQMTGHGVDLVVEVGGVGTLNESIRATKRLGRRPAGDGRRDRRQPHEAGGGQGVSIQRGQGGVRPHGERRAFRQGSDRDSVTPGEGTRRRNAADTRPTLCPTAGAKAGFLLTEFHLDKIFSCLIISQNGRMTLSMITHTRSYRRWSC